MLKINKLKLSPAHCPSIPSSNYPLLHGQVDPEGVLKFEDEQEVQKDDVPEQVAQVQEQAKRWIRCLKGISVTHALFVNPVVELTNTTITTISNNRSILSS